MAANTWITQGARLLMSTEFMLLTQQAKKEYLTFGFITLDTSIKLNNCINNINTKDEKV